MQNHITRAGERASVSYAFEDLPMPPASMEAPPQQAIVSDATLGHIALAANILITLIIVVAMIVDGSQAKTAIVVGALYFGLSTFVFAIVTTGGLTAIINAYQRERTERQRIDAYRELGAMALAWRMEVERNRLLEPLQRPPHDFRPDVGGVQRVSPLNTFVEPYADQERAVLEGVRWAEKLYDRSALGAPDPRKVQLDGESIGRLKIRMIGSKRGGGSREAGVFLIRQGVIRKVAGGYALVIENYPYRHYVSTLAPR